MNYRRTRKQDGTIHHLDLFFNVIKMYEVYFDDGRETHSYYYYKMENAIKKYNEILEEFKKEDIKRK